MRQGYYTCQRNVGWGLGELYDTSTRCAHIAQTGHPRNRPRSSIVATPGSTWSPINAHVMDAHTPCHGRPSPASHGHPHTSDVTAHHGHSWGVHVTLHVEPRHRTDGKPRVSMYAHAKRLVDTHLGAFRGLPRSWLDVHKVLGVHVIGWASTKSCGRPL